MKILMMAINDPAGTAIAFCKALNAHAGVEARLVTLETRYNHGWEKDLHLPDLDESGVEHLREVMRQADVFHFHMTADEHLEIGPLIPRDHMAGKTMVHHHHGHPDFRDNPGKYHEKYRGLGRKNLIVSTPDLLEILPDAVWVPNLVAINDPALVPLDLDKPFPPFKLAHSPTRKDLKNTDELLAAVKILADMGMDIDLDMIDNASNLECLARKRACHALFDHMQGYYGVSSLEGLSQGLAVIAGINEFNRGHIVEFAGTEDLPWLTATDVDSLTLVLAALASDPDLVTETGKKARQFMENHWSDKKVASRLAEFYMNCV